MKVRKFLLLLLAFSGLIDSIYTLILHGKIISSQFTYRSFCAISEFVNCDIVITSKYGKILGIHNSVYGIITYIAIIVFILFNQIKERPKNEIFYSYMFGISLFISLLSVYFALVSFLIIKALCIMCLGIYLINFTMLSLVLYDIVKEKYEPFKVLYSHLYFMFAKRTALSIISIFVFLSMVAILYQHNVNRERKEWYERYSDILTGNTKIQNVNIESAPSLGSENAKIVIVEFSDFQCPFCKDADEILDRIFMNYRDRIRIVFKHFPLDTNCNLLIQRQVHEYACISALSSICAEEQGKFWDYKKLLFKHQKTLRLEKLIELAREAGLDIVKFTDCITTPGDRMQKIVSDIHQGYELGVRSTPTLFLNGKMIKGAVPEWLLQEIIEKELTLK